LARAHPACTHTWGSSAPAKERDHMCFRPASMACTAAIATTSQSTCSELAEQPCPSRTQNITNTTIGHQVVSSVVQELEEFPGKPGRLPGSVCFWPVILPGGSSLEQTARKLALSGWPKEVTPLRRQPELWPRALCRTSGQPEGLNSPGGVMGILCHDTAVPDNLHSSVQCKLLL
jgi:hypothetical protein